MKRILKTTLVFCLLFCMAFCFSACSLELTPENLVGNYHVTHVVYTPSADNIGINRAVDMTRADYEALIARKDAGTASSEDEENYIYFASDFRNVMEVKEDGTIYDHYEDDPVYLNGYWEINDGKIDYRSEMNTMDDFSVEWDDGKLIITWTVDRSDPMKGTTVFIYEKVA